MKKLIALLIIFATGYATAFSQSLSITINGPSPAWDGSRVAYNIFASGNMPASPNFTATVTNGTIIDQNLDPYSGSKMYLAIQWNCGVTSGNITVTETVTNATNSFPVTIQTYTVSNYCMQASPIYQEPLLTQLPGLLTVENCSHYCPSTGGYTYQWQQGTVLQGNTIPTSYTDIPGATSITYQPPAMSSYKKMGYRRLTHFAALSGINILGIYNIYSEPAIIDYHPPLEAGSISGGGIIQYGTVPIVTSVPASAGSCPGFTGYFYTWMYSNGDGNWHTLGYGEQYPANTPIEGNWALIRKVQCGTTELLSNLIQFTLTELDPGSISGGGMVVAGTIPSVTQTPATGGACSTPNYEYTWERTADGAPWTVVGTGEAYPNIAIYGQTAIRRKAKCGTEEKYSNNIWFSISPYTSPNTEDKNYIRVNTILIPGIGGWAHADNLPTGDKIQSTTYFDGLSRPIQKVTKEASELQPNTWKDVVSFTEYDAAGRVPKSFLPYPSVTNTGKFKDNPLTEQQSFITTTFNEPVGAPTFSQTTFDNSPLSRPVNSKASGAGWGGNVAYSGNSYQYEFNTATEDIKIWTIDFAEADIPRVTGVYEAGKLYKSILVDDNQKKVYEYKDYSGNVILKKVQLDNAVDENGYDGWLCTYYVYDDMGQLRSTITPKAVSYLKTHSWVFTNSDVYKELCFYNYFDERGRIVIKHSAGAGESHLVYDKRNRMVLSQDENQRNRAAKQWSFYLYDNDNRQVVSGLLDNNSVNRGQYQTYVNSLNNENINLSIFTGQNETVVAHNPVAGSGNLGNGASNLVINSVTYFDNYDYAGAKPFNSNYTFAPTNNYYVQPTEKANNVLAKATGSKVRVIDDVYDDNNPSNDKFLTSTSYYDNKGKTLQGLTDNIKGGTDYITMQYDFAGKILSVYEKQNFTGTGYTNFAVITKLEYNKIGKLLAISKKYHTQEYKKIVSLTYDAMGRVKVKKLSPDFNGGTGIESLQYDYNLHGSLIGINKDYALSNSSLAQWDNYFGLYLGYDNRDNKFTNARYDGNLTGIIWKGQGDNNPRKYDYVYDNVGRLSAANFMQKEKPVDATWTNTAVDFSMTNVQYDENGNLAAMFQKGIIPGKETPIFVDKLAYTYKTVSDGTWSNKLDGVVDNTSDLSQANNGLLGDFKDESYGTGGTDYQYDANGNMVLDNNKKIRIGNGSGITYNFMDKPQKVTIEGKSITEFIYDAAGDKLGKKVTNTVTSQITTTWYNGAFIYEETTSGIKLQYINHEEGRIRVFAPLANQPRIELGNNFDLPDGLKGVFEFFVKDHLQNVRAVLSEEIHNEYHNCTMENNDANVAQYEESIFGQQGAANEVTATRITKANDAYAQGWTSNTSIKVSKLPAAAGNIGTIGPNMMLKVMAGDNLNLHVDYYYNQPVSNGNNNVLGPLVNTLTSIIGQGTQTTNTVHGAGNDINTNLNNSSGQLNQFLQGNDQNQSSNPRAYLNYLFFDENFKFVPYDNITGLGSYAIPVTTPGDGQQITKANVKVPKNGYVFIYLSNNSNINVYFDNLEVKHERKRLVEENAYYPYGLKIKSISGRAFDKLENNYGYQGAFAEEDEETGWNEFALRMYNPQIGRWNGVDLYNQFASPYMGMGDNPANKIDPSGGFIFDGVGSMIGMGAGLVGGIIWTVSSGDKSGGGAAARIFGSMLAGALIGAGFDGALNNDHVNVSSIVPKPNLSLPIGYPTILRDATGAIVQELPEIVKKAFRMEWGIEVRYNNGYLYAVGNATPAGVVSPLARKTIMNALTSVASEYARKLEFGYNLKVNFGITDVDYGVTEKLGRNGNIKIDLADFEDNLMPKNVVWPPGLSPRAFNLGRLIEHEWIGHELDDYIDNLSDASNPFIPGEVEDKVGNVIRKELGLPIRMNYVKWIDKNTAIVEFSEMRLVPFLTFDGVPIGEEYKAVRTFTLQFVIK